MKTFSKYLFIALTAMLLFSMTSCDDKDEVEYNLPGKWYTDEEFNYGGYTWGVGTVMSFDEDHNGYISGGGDKKNRLYFTWYWRSGYRYDTTMMLEFDDGTTAYIEGADASYRTFSGTWYNTLRDLEDGPRYGYSFQMHRVN